MLTFTTAHAVRFQYREPKKPTYLFPEDSQKGNWFDSSVGFQLGIDSSFGFRLRIDWEVSDFEYDTDRQGIRGYSLVLPRAPIRKRGTTTTQARRVLYAALS